MNLEFNDIKGALITMTVAFIYWIIKKLGGIVKKIDDSQANRVKIEQIERDISTMKADINRIENKLMK